MTPETILLYTPYILSVAALVGLGVPLTRICLLELEIRRMPDEERDLCRRGWISPNRFRLFRVRELQRGYYGAYHPGGRVQVYFHSYGMWSLDGKPTSRPEYIYKPSDPPIRLPKD